MEWSQVVATVGVLTAVIGLQSFWIARALDAIRIEMHRDLDAVRSEMHRGFDRVEARLDVLEGREPPSLRRA